MKSTLPDESSLAHAADRLRQLAHDLASDGSHAEWRALIDSLEATTQALRDEIARVRIGPPRVVCVGRTKAGKSTLRFVLTGDGAEGIGHGGQRTTLQSCEYEWQGIRLVDTPGVGALGGADDEVAALAAAAEADLVLWVTSSDGKQQATITPVLRAVSGRPLLALVNHKGTFTPEELAVGLPDEVLFDDRAGQEARIQSLVAHAGHRPEGFEILHAQLGLARRARQEGNEACWSDARLPQLESALMRAAAAGAENRGEIRARQLRDAGLACRESAAAASTATHAAARHHRERVRASNRSQRRLIAAFQEEVHHVVELARIEAEARLTAALRFARVEPHRGKASEHMRSELDTALNEFVESVTEAVRDLWIRTGPQLFAEHCRVPPPVLDHATATHTELKGDPNTARGVDWVARGLKLCLAGAAIVLTDGIAAPIVIGLVGERGLAMSRQSLPTVGEEQQARDKSVAEAFAAYEEQLTSLKDLALRAVDRWLQELVQPRLIAARQDANERVERLSAWSAELKKLSSQLATAVAMEGVSAE